MTYEWDPEKDRTNEVFHDSAVVSQALREYLAEHGAPPTVLTRPE